MWDCLQETRLPEFFFIILILSTVTFVPRINVFAEKRIRKLDDLFMGLPASAEIHLTFSPTWQTKLCLACS